MCNEICLHVIIGQGTASGTNGVIRYDEKLWPC